MLSPTMQIEYYPRLGVISQFGTIGIGPWVFHRLPAGVFTKYRQGINEYLFGGHISANRFLQMYAPVGVDDGNIFTATLETGMNDFGVPARTKYLRRIRILGRGRCSMSALRNFETAIYKSKALDMSSNQDLWSTSDVWGSGTWGPSSLFKEVIWNPDAYGRYFQARFTDSDTGVSRKLIEVGSREYSLTAGEWAIYMVTLEGAVLGVRDG
jgi:hypothetical protein